ncbi:helix-turn-helix transcriptional regulator [Lactococcus lactis]|uniref:helix-turn-helix transcriptional regulator n=1 Tax=Lactococcus lactis TaxID=1358 RepID=UPI00339B506B
MEKERLDIDSQSNKSIFYERLLILSNLKRESFNRIEINLGYSRNALNNYKNGTTPSGSRLLELTNYFQVTPGYLMGMEDELSVLSPDLLFQLFTQEQKIEMLPLCQNWLLSKTR